MYEASELIVEWPEPSTAVLSLVGAHDLSALETLRYHTDVATDGCRTLVIDLTRTTFIDSASIAVLIDAERRLALRGARLVLAIGDTSNIGRVIDLTGLSSHFAVVRSLDEALLAAAPNGA